jgi:hypothetical protein
MSLAKNRHASAACSRGLFAGMTAAAAAGSLGGPLELQDEGVFFVNAQTTTTIFPGYACDRRGDPGEITIDQMYVQYCILKTVADR